VSYRFRLIDTAGSEVAIVVRPSPAITEGDLVLLPGGGTAAVVEVYDDADGREGDVQATLVIDDEPDELP
jgi:hypothetical protein